MWCFCFQEPVKTVKTARVAKRIGATNFVECSAKTNENLQRVFEFATRAALEWSKKKETSGDQRQCTLF